MSGCLNTDMLVSLGAALEWDPEERLRHVLECEECARELRHLTVVRAVFTEERAPRTGFVDEVTAALGTGAEPRSVSTKPLVMGLNALLAGGTAFFTIALAAGRDSPVRIGVPALAAVIAVMTGTLLWNSLSGHDDLPVT